jgi:small-conductance mechanosensitive channel
MKIKILIAFTLIMLWGIMPFAGLAENMENEPSSVMDEILPLPKEKKPPVRTEHIDIASEKIEKRLNEVSGNFSKYVGNWINTKIMFGITWLKLIACLILLISVVGVERAVRALLRYLQDKIKMRGTPGLWNRTTLETISKPLSLAVLVYGFYGALSPLYEHFETKNGGNAILGIAKYAADIGGSLAVVWFIYLFARLIYAEMIKWSASHRSIGVQALNSFLQDCRSPLKLLLSLMLIRTLFPILENFHGLSIIFQNVFGLLLIGDIAWMIVQGTSAIEEIFLKRYRIDVKDNLHARTILTQVRFMKRLLIVMVTVLAVASMLMLFEKVRQFGTSILASAGIMGLVVGLAAQRTIANLLVGVQIALTQPIRIDDVVIIENEWGKIEEIASTFAVVRIWDSRRLIVPLTYFTEKPFQNWTRTSADLLGTVYIYVDYSIPVEEIRRELYRILNTSMLWDGKTWCLQVTNTTEKTIELRAMMSAADAPLLWDLKCAVREQLIAFIQQSYPNGLPKIRTDLSAANSQLLFSKRSSSL